MGIVPRKNIERRLKNTLFKSKNTGHKIIDTTGVTQISTSDPDSRQIMTRNNISEVAYTVQTTVDALHDIPIDFKVTNENDSKAMGGMLRRCKTILGTTISQVFTIKDITLEVNFIRPTN
jgi:hypothetical protein